MSPEIDPYVYPGTDVLRNNFAIRNARSLQIVEDNITAAKLAQLERRPLPGRYDVAHLQSFHREIFADVYPWAGEIRSVYIAKSQLFAAPQHIRPYLDDQLAQPADENHLRGLNRSRFVERATHYLAELNAVHPFREGNGRAQRAFVGQLARDAGYKIAWRYLDAKRNVDASIASLDGDNTRLQELLDELIEPSSGRIQ